MGQVSCGSRWTGRKRDYRPDADDESWVMNQSFATRAAPPMARLAKGLPPGLGVLGGGAGSVAVGTEGATTGPGLVSQPASAAVREAASKIREPRIIVPIVSV